MALNKNKESVTENSVVGKQGVTILKKGKRCNGDYLQANSNKTHWEVSVKFKENGKEQRYGWGYKGHSLNRIIKSLNKSGENLVSSGSHKAL